MLSFNDFTSEIIPIDNSIDQGETASMYDTVSMLRLVLVGGALRQVSEVCERYVTQQGLVGTWTGLGFNLCVAPTLTFCPCILDGGKN